MIQILVCSIQEVIPFALVITTGAGDEPSTMELGCISDTQQNCFSAWGGGGVSDTRDGTNKWQGQQMAILILTYTEAGFITWKFIDYLDVNFSYLYYV